MRTLKWIYNLGKLHERRRIELAISKFKRSNEYEVYTTDEKELRRLREYNAEIEREIRDILYPKHTTIVEKGILDD